MVVYPFICYESNYDFVMDVIYLLPFILSFGPLVRKGAWLGVAACFIFFSTSIAMLYHNAICRGGSTGFLRAEVY
jgi:hypothetical protein